VGTVSTDSSHRTELTGVAPGPSFLLLLESPRRDRGQPEVRARVGNTAGLVTELKALHCALGNISKWEPIKFFT